MIKYILYNNNYKIRIDKFLSKNIKNISRSYIKKLILNNNIIVNDNIIMDPNFILRFNEKIIVLNNKKKIITKNNNLKLNIIYEDDDILLINKQFGVTINSEFNDQSCLFINSLIKYYPNIYNVTRFGIVHRLDKNTTGIIILAKSELSFLNLKKMFLYRKIIKEYSAIVSGLLISGNTINLPILRNKKNRKIMCVDLKGKQSITHYKIIKKFNLHTYIKIIIETGRTHQIRTHMSYIGHPLVGDNIYGKNSSNFKKSFLFLKNKNIFFKRQALHSSKIMFKHPINNKDMSFSIDIPTDMKFLLKNI